jgi:hypothetical protein
MADKDRIIKALLTAAALAISSEAAADGDKMVYLKPVAEAASSFDDSEWAPEPEPSAVSDGDFNTRWSSVMGKDNEWIYLDFGKQKTVTEVVIYWERAYAAEFEIQSSDDAMNWKTIALVKDGKGEKDTVSVPKTTAQYLRLVGLKRFNPDWGFSVWELEAYGPAELNPRDLPVEQVFPGRRPREEVKLVMEEPGASPGAIRPGEFQKGVNYSSYNEVDLALQESDEMLAYLKTINVTDVCIIVTWYQDSLESMSMSPDAVGAGPRVTKRSSTR